MLQQLKSPAVKKRQYTCEEVINKYKDDYERMVKALKREHDKNMIEEDIKISDLETKLKELQEEKEDSNERNNKTYGHKVEDYKEEIKKINKFKTNAEYTTIALMEAEKIWLVIKIAVVANENFTQMKDDEKIELICANFKEFYNNFPIVSRYMICMGQYKQKAFRKFLKKCEQKLNHTPTEREKDYMQNQWIECQASYVKYLWEEMQTKRYSQKESQAIWQQTHKALTEEFKQFKTNHAQVEEKIKLEDKKNKVELLSEAVHRVSTGAQKLDLEKMRVLVNKLRDKKYQQNYKLVLDQIVDKIDRVNPSVKGWGTNVEAQQEYEEELKKQECKQKYKKMDLTPQMV